MAAPFSANRDIKVEASEVSPGFYVLRTRGLADRKRPELEISGVPEAALNGAGGVINMLADYTVNNAEVLADQNVGNVLAVGDDGRKLLMVVRAVVAEKPKGGLWSKIAGGGKGVLRLVDVTESSGAPLTALATMLVYRAEVRLAQDDEAGARAELDAAVATLPGDPAAGDPPSLGGVDGAFNWQNHLAYLHLATLAGDDLDLAAESFGAALARSAALARAELGASVEAVLALDDSEVAAEAQRIVEHNLAAVHRSPAPSRGLAVVASPIWELEGGLSVRRASLLPAGQVDLYYEGQAAERLRSEGPALAGAILARDRVAPWRAAWVARATRTLWVVAGAPIADSVGPTHPAHGLVSSVLADVARCFRAGASGEEILARFGPRSEEPSPALAAIEAKLRDLADAEAEHYIAALSP